MGLTVLPEARSPYPALLNCGIVSETDGHCTVQWSEVSASVVWQGVDLGRHTQGEQHNWM